jgi:phospholipase C
MLRLFLDSCAALVAAALAQIFLATMGLAHEPDIPPVTLQPDPGPDVAPFYRDWTKGAEPRLSREETIERLRAAMKYVFVIFQENESFDNYFGTFPERTGFTRTASIHERPRIRPALPKLIRVSRAATR